MTPAPCCGCRYSTAAQTGSQQGWTGHGGQGLRRRSTSFLKGRQDDLAERFSEEHHKYPECCPPGSTWLTFDIVDGMRYFPHQGQAFRKPKRSTTSLKNVPDFCKIELNTASSITGSDKSARSLQPEGDRRTSTISPRATSTSDQRSRLRMEHRRPSMSSQPLRHVADRSRAGLRIHAHQNVFRQAADGLRTRSSRSAPSEHRSFAGPDHRRPLLYSPL